MEHVTEGSLMIAGGSTHHRRAEWTVKEYAEVEGVTERTVWSWIAKGAISVRRTPGGRVRIPSGLK
jgi:excisionase family DNA binding protein